MGSDLVLETKFNGPSLIFYVPGWNEVSGKNLEQVPCEGQ